MADLLVEAGAADRRTRVLLSRGSGRCHQGGGPCRVAGSNAQPVVPRSRIRGAGTGLDDVLDCFNADGRGAIVTSSRGIIYAAGEDDAGWAAAVSDAAASFADQIGRATGLRS